MTTFKQFLQERAMNQSAYASVLKRLGKSAKAGFEFEMLVPSDSKLYDGAERESIQLRRLTSADDLYSYFSLSRTDVRKMEREHEDWIDEKKAEWIDEHAPDFEETDEDGDVTNEDEARERAQEMFDEDFDVSWEKFVKDKYGDVHTLVKDNRFEPQHGWEDDRGDDYSTVFVTEPSGDVEKAVFQNIEQMLKTYVNIKGWDVVADGSISGDGQGAEVISPPTPLEAALEDLRSVFQMMYDYDIQTNSSTGLHINLSLPNLDKLDPVKLVLFMGEEYALKLFGRLQNHYTQPQLDGIFSAIRGRGKLPSSGNAMIDIAVTGLKNSKYYSVNLSKLRNGYLEFRVAGGENYHLREHAVVATVMRFVSALELACNPAEERNEYIKKLSKVFAQSLQGPFSSDNLQTMTIDDILRAGLYTLKSRQLTRYLNDAKAGNPSDEARKWLATEFPEIFSRAMLSSRVKQLYPKQRAELQMIAKKLGFNPADWSADFKALIGLKK